MNVRIRPAAVTDVDALATVAALAFPLATPSDTEPAAVVAFIDEHLSRERFVAYLADPDRDVLVATVDDEVVGYSILIRGEPADPEVTAAVTTRPTVDLNKFYVHPDQHGRGVASTLMAAVVDTARASGARSLWLGVNNENARANRFYEKHGFAVVGTKHFLLGDRFEDDFVRERPL